MAISPISNSESGSSVRTKLNSALSFVSVPLDQRKIIVDPSQTTNSTNKVFQTLQAGLDYLVTQTPTTTNPWSVLIDPKGSHSVTLDSSNTTTLFGEHDKVFISAGQYSKEIISSISLGAAAFINIDQVKIGTITSSNNVSLKGQSVIISTVTARGKNLTLNGEIKVLTVNLSGVNGVDGINGGLGEGGGPGTNATSGGNLFISGGSIALSYNLNGGNGGNGGDGGNGQVGNDGSNGFDGTDDGMGTPSNGTDGSQGGNGGNGGNGGIAGDAGSGGDISIDALSILGSGTFLKGTIGIGGAGGIGGTGGAGGIGGTGVNGGSNGSNGGSGDSGSAGSVGSDGSIGEDGSISVSSTIKPIVKATKTSTQGVGTLGAGVEVTWAETEDSHNRFDGTRLKVYPNETWLINVALAAVPGSTAYFEVDINSDIIGHYTPLSYGKGVVGPYWTMKATAIVRSSVEDSFYIQFIQSDGTPAEIVGSPGGSQLAVFQAVML